MDLQKSGFKLLIIDGDEKASRPLGAFLERHGLTVFRASDGKAGRRLWQQHRPEIVISEQSLPDCLGTDLLQEVMNQSPNTVFIIITGDGDIDTAVDSLRHGAFFFLRKPASPERLLELLQTGAQEKLFYHNQHSGLSGADEYPPECLLVGQSPGIQQVRSLIHLVKDRSTTVLITGETGTGKELVARAIHFSGRRREGAFLCINCAAIPNDLLEDELFGHVKGAYTGASQTRKGYFEMAHEGTLFLDEIGNMGPSIQQKLLRVLEDHQITPLGTTRSMEVDVRIVAATNADLAKLVRENSFREDLFYRLNVFPIHVTPLRQRREDIPFLVQHFVVELAQREGIPAKRVSPECMEILCNRGWPGNIRELRNAVEYSMIVSGMGKIIEPRHFQITVPPPATLQPRPAAAAGMAPANPPATAAAGEESVAPTPFQEEMLTALPDFQEGIDFSAVVLGVEKKLLIEGLKQTGGNKQKTAKLLKMKRTTLVEKLKRLKLD